MAVKYRRLVKFYPTPDERDELAALARQTNVSMSELVRRLVTGRPLPASDRHHAVRDLLKINADLARLGNLFKLALDEDEYVLPDGMDLNDLYARIRDTQNLLKSKVREL